MILRGFGNAGIFRKEKGKLYTDKAAARPVNPSGAAKKLCYRTVAFSRSLELRFWSATRPAAQVHGSLLRRDPQSTGTTLLFYARRLLRRTKGTARNAKTSSHEVLASEIVSIS